jgi:hypothetical protein
MVKEKPEFPDDNIGAVLHSLSLKKKQQLSISLWRC